MNATPFCYSELCIFTLSVEVAITSVLILCYIKYPPSVIVLPHHEGDVYVEKGTCQIRGYVEEKPEATITTMVGL